VYKLRSHCATLPTHHVCKSVRVHLVAHTFFFFFLIPMAKSKTKRSTQNKHWLFCHQAWGEGYTRGGGYREHTCNLTAPQTGMQGRSGSLGLLLPLVLCIQYIQTCRSTPWRRGNRHGVSKLPHFNVHQDVTRDGGR
jgi:hypothetical protein